MELMCKKKMNIDNNCRIGFNTVILKNSIIKDNTIIIANILLTSYKEHYENFLIGGHNKVIKRYS